MVLGAYVIWFDAECWVCGQLSVPHVAMSRSPEGSGCLWAGVSSEFWNGPVVADTQCQCFSLIKRVHMLTISLMKCIFVVTQTVFAYLNSIYSTALLLAVDFLSFRHILMTLNGVVMCADVSTLCLVHWWMKYIEGWCVGETIFPVSTWKGAVVVGLLGLNWSLLVVCRWKAIQVPDVCKSIQPERCSTNTSNEAHWRPSLSVWLLSIGVFSARQSPCTYSGTILSVCCHPLCASIGSLLAVGCRVIDCCSAQL